MSNALQLVLSNPNPGFEDEFNAWYGGEHLIHGVETPGVLSGQRFRRAEGPWPSGKHDYMMIWELDDPAFTLAELAKVKGTAEMPISPAINMDTVQPPTMWRRAQFRNAARIVNDSASRQTVIFGLYNAAEAQDSEFAEALLSGGLMALADQPGVISADYLTLADEQIRGNCRKYSHGLLIELHDEAQGIAALKDRLTTLPQADPERWMAIVFRPIAGKTTKADLAAR
jgi:CTP:molybdopterin cytidylyltransferase MocA